MNAVLFGDCLSKILNRKRVSVTELAERMGYRSRTSLVRVIHNKANAESLEQFLNKFEQMAIADEPDIEALREALEVSRMGVTQYRAWKGLSALMHDRPQPVWDAGALDDGSAAAALDALIDACDQAQRFDMVVVNCCWSSVFERLNGMLDQRKGAPDQFAHYFTLTDDTYKTVRTITALLPMLCSTRFNSHTLRVHGQPTDEIGLLAGDLISCVIENSSGETREMLCLFQNEHSAMILTLEPSRGLYVFLRGAIESHEGRCQPLAQTLPPVLTPENYLKMTEQLDALEWGRNLYSMESDLCIRCVHPDVVINAFMPERMANLPSHLDDYQALIQRYYKSQTRRYANIFQNKCASHMILSQKAMRQFAETGRLQVHFFALRAFTVPERIAILHNCLEHAKNNGYFNIYFRKDDEMPMTHGFSLLERHALVIYNACSDYNAEFTNPQVMLTDPDIVGLFVDYFRKELLKKHVMPYFDGLRFLDSLIEELKATQR